MNIKDIATKIEIMMKIKDQLDQFRNRVFMLTNAVQQL